MVRETRSRKVTLAVSADTEMLDVSNVNSSLSSSRKRTISDATKLEDPDREIEPTAGTPATASEPAAPEPGAAEDMKEQDDAKEEEMTMKPPVSTKKAPIRKASGRGRGAASKDANVEDKLANTAASKGDDEDGDDAPVVSDLVPVQEQEEQEAVTMPPKRTAPKRGRPRGTGARGRAASTTSRKPSIGRGRGRRKAVAEDEDDGDNDDDEDFHADQDTTSSSLPPPSQEPTRRSARSRAPPKDPYVETLAIEASKPKPKSQNPRGRGGRKKKMTPEELWSPENRVSQNSPFIRMDMTVSSLSCPPAPLLQTETMPFIPPTLRPFFLQ